MRDHLFQFKQNLFRSSLEFIIGPERLQFYQTIDWQQEISRFETLNFNYPSYYTSVNFHGIEGGYLNPIAALTYDTVTPLATPPNETWIRQCLIKTIEGQPQQILDVGCGTGSSTIILKEAFPNATVIGLDLSPYMLVMADYKAQQKELNIEWQQELAESTSFESSRFDVVTLSMLLHETPPYISQSILREAFRLITPGGQLIILDGNQKRLRHILWLTKLFQEPYSAVYSYGNLNEWLSLERFEQIKTKPIWWIYQVTHSIKPKSCN